jgi:pre-peptidase
LSTGAFNLSSLARVASVLLTSLVFAEAALAQSAPGTPRPSPPGWIGTISRSTPGDIHPGDTLVGRARNATDSSAVICSGKPVENLLVTPDSTDTRTASVSFILPQIEPGFVDCRLRNGAQESEDSRILVMDMGGTLTEVLSGSATYQKLDVTDIGLDTEHPTLRPIRNARVEVYEAGRVISVSRTDSNGEFAVPVPPDTTVVVRVVSRLRSVDLKVEDNTNGSQFYYILSPDINTRDHPSAVPLTDRTRKSGAFNILEQVQRANDFVRASDPQFLPFPFTIFWSERNQRSFGPTNIKDGLVGTTFFSFTSSTAYILGDRNTDSDEYDDSVLIHEYAHMLAAKFSRDDSIGGAHRLGDNLDPRVAWSEGWANFFSAAVRSDSVYRDSSGPNGVNVLRFDLEDNYPPGSWTGYGSETSVQALLWDFYDDKNEPGDLAQFDFSQMWAAFTDLDSNHFVYMQNFLDHLVARNPSASDSIQRMAQSQAIDFQPGEIPSVTNPFPSFIAMNSVRSGELDSFSTRRTNLAQSSHFFIFTTNGGLLGIQLTVAPGTIGNPSSNDLDLYLYDANGRQVAKSAVGRSGQSESITILAPTPGAYVIEIRSYYTSTRGYTVFNSGRYKLGLFSASNP